MLKILFIYSLSVSVPKCVVASQQQQKKNSVLTKDTPQNPTARMIPSKIVFHATYANGHNLY